MNLDSFLDEIVGADIYLEPQYHVPPLIVFLYKDRIIFHSSNEVYQTALLDFILSKYKDKLPSLIKILSKDLVVYCALEFAPNERDKIENLIIVDVYSLADKKFLLPEIAANKVAPLRFIKFHKYHITDRQILLKIIENIPKKEKIFIKRYDTVPYIWSL